MWVKFRGLSAVGNSSHVVGPRNSYPRPRWPSAKCNFFFPFPTKVNGYYRRIDLLQPGFEDSTSSVRYDFKGLVKLELIKIFGRDFPVPNHVVRVAEWKKNPEPE